LPKSCRKIAKRLKKLGGKFLAKCNGKCNENVMNKKSTKNPTKKSTNGRNFLTGYFFFLLTFEQSKFLDKPYKF